MDLLSALRAAGVDNWGGYDAAMASLPPNASDEDVLDALLDGGVDNWEGYDVAQEMRR